MTDFYLEHPEELKGQPKKTIGEYAKENNILVPRIFENLKDGRKSHKGIFLRSEHQQDYNGISGLFESLRPSFETPGGFCPRGLKTMEDIKREYFKFEESTKNNPFFKKYCYYLDKDEEELKEEASFSVWENIKGANRAVIADSSIPGRYHIISAEGLMWNYLIFENGKIVKENLDPLPTELKKGLKKLIETYEAIRNLDRFDANHCPIMEFQTHKGKDYFLQYHRTRDFTESEFTLDRNPRKGEIEVPFVRGATPKKGMVCKVTLYYGNQRTGDLKPEIEDGSYDLGFNHVFSELRTRKRKIQLYSKKNMENAYNDLVEGHLGKSKIFKPQVSIIHHLNDICSNEEGSDICRKSSLSGKNQYIDLYVISDGKKAYIKRI